MAKQLNYYGTRITLNRKGNKHLRSPCHLPVRSFANLRMRTLRANPKPPRQSPHSNTSDEDFEPEPVVSVVPGSPQSGKRSSMTIFPDDREDAPEEEPVEGEVQEDATGEEAGDVEGQDQDEGGYEDEEADGNGGVAVQEKCWGGDEEDVDVLTRKAVMKEEESTWRRRRRRRITTQVRTRLKDKEVEHGKSFIVRKMPPRLKISCY